jgi:O-antigen/teichoic acid export membrane protein
MVYFDRFLVGAVISMSAVAYYATPYEFVTKLWLIPGALMSVLFPAFASSYREDPAHAADLFHQAVKYQLLAIFPLVFVIVLGARHGLALWLGNEFADTSYLVLQVLAIGVFINCLAHVPFSFLQGIGKPDVTSKLYIAELVLYIPALWFLVRYFGINGAAFAWTARVAVDTILLFYVTGRHIRPLSGISRSTTVCAVTAVAGLLGVVAVPGGRVVHACMVIGMLAFMLTGWKVLLSARERSCLAGKVTRSV